MTKAQISWTIGIIASLIAIGSSIKGFWNEVGWITPAQSEERHTESEQLIKDFRDEWKCDEYEEELIVLKRRLKRMSSDDDDYVELDHKIERIENKMEDTECSRFEDFG